VCVCVCVCVRECVCVYVWRVHIIRVSSMRVGMSWDELE
jgi:hypothetical protein